MPDTTPETERPFDPAAADQLADFFRPGGFPGFTIEERRAWTSWQVRDVLTHHRNFLRQTIEVSVREVLRQRAYAKDEAKLLAEKCSRYRSELDDAHKIIQRVTARMEDYAEHAPCSVNVRQVLNLLSPTWPDGNHEAPAPAEDEPR